MASSITMTGLIFHDFFAQLDFGALLPQFGFGGVVIWIVVAWLRRVESGLEKLEHTMRGLSKAIWLDLAERAAPGSFVREEARKTVERMRRNEENGGSAD